MGLGLHAGAAALTTLLVAVPPLRAQQPQDFGAATFVPPPGWNADSRGWGVDSLQGASRLAGKAAAADITLGAGRVTMFGFRPLYRGQSYGTFTMFFNALLESGAPRM